MILPPALLAGALLLAPKGYLCSYTQSPIKIDGDLNDRAWRGAPWTSDFVDIEGDMKPKPRYRTRVKMLWDDTYLYIAAELEEPQIQASLTKHDSTIFKDNDFEVFIDPDGDGQKYSEFEMNALNTTWDLELLKPYRSGGPYQNSWEINGTTAVKLHGSLNDPAKVSKGWTVEIAFPLKSFDKIVSDQPFGYPTSPIEQPKGDHKNWHPRQWRINFSRVEWQWDVVAGRYIKRPNTREDNWVWSPQGVVDMHRPEMWGYIQFTKSRRDRLRPLPGWREQQELSRVWELQRDFRRRFGHFASSARELGVDSWFHLVSSPKTFTADWNGYAVDNTLRFWRLGE